MSLENLYKYPFVILFDVMIPMNGDLVENGRERKRRARMRSEGDDES